MKYLRTISLFIGALVVVPAQADGVREINQACVNIGCFAGDNPGFPVEIVNPGAYRLSSNLTTGPANVTAIQVTGDNIDLDLGGFTVFGPNSCTDTGSGIACATTNGADLVEILGSHITIHDGVVSGGAGRGIRLGANFGSNDLLIARRMHVTQSGGAGIDVFGKALVEECSTTLNASSGFFGNDSSTRFNRNYAVRNGGDGIILGSCQDNTSTDNFGANFQCNVDLGGNSS
ncbi:MAG: hypothetical protein Kow0020_05820 [Wenzhouxiangellaceae bacterium]